MNTFGKLLRPWALLAAAGLLLGGCSSTVHRFNQRFDATLGPKAKTVNVYQEAALPEHLRRVAILPFYLGEYDHVDMADIEQTFAGELMKRNLFEVVPVSEEEMERLFEETRFSSVEPLPTKLLTRLHAAYHIDAIMLVDVSYFHAFEPVALGVRAKLFDGHEGEIIWAADQLFDSSHPAVSNAARKHYKTESLLPYPMNDTTTVLHSPTRFSKYVARSIFSTIEANRLKKN